MKASGLQSHGKLGREHHRCPGDGAAGAGPSFPAGSLETPRVPPICQGARAVRCCGHEQH